MSAGLSLPVRGAMKLLLTTLILLMIVSLVLAERNNGHWHGIRSRLALGRLSRAAVAELVQSPEVFLVEPRPPRAAVGRPEIARQAADEVLFAIVDLDELLPTLIAALFVADIGHGLNCSN